MQHLASVTGDTGIAGATSHVRERLTCRTAKCLDGCGVHDQRLWDMNKGEIQPFFAKLCERGEAPWRSFLASRQQSEMKGARVEVREPGGDRSGRCKSKRIGHGGLRDMEEEEDWEKWCREAAQGGKPCWKPLCCLAFFSETQREPGRQSASPWRGSNGD